MQKLLLVVSFFLCFLTYAAAQNTEKYVRVQILLKDKTMEQLAALGVEADHGWHLPGQSFTTEMSATELGLVQRAGFETVILQDDLETWYKKRAAQSKGVTDRSFACINDQPVRQYPTPANYTYGSMGGYHNYKELLAVLDDMAAKYPNLITLRSKVSDTLLTHEGRPLWQIKISTNPNTDEDEPEVLYTALHHAREPNGMSQMLFFMWYLLENYGKNEEVNYILNHSELYFIPCINPDGYVFNETNNPQGGGYWRKNRRQNSATSFGVDLNRNYGFKWGNDNSGSSPNEQSDTYRGPGPFSEPETRMMRDFCLKHNFLFVQNYHTFSNLLIYPWAYSDIPADSFLVKYARLFVRENKYKSGTASETVGYPVNGSSDDWMYATTGAMSFTPEVGTTGFWPEKNEIEGLNRENVWTNLATALSALHFGEITVESNLIENRINFDIPYQVVRYGRQYGPMTVSLKSLSPSVASVGGPQTFTLDIFQKKTGHIAVALKPTIKPGESLTLVLQLNNGFYSRTDTIQKIFTGGTTNDLRELLVETGNNLNKWVNDGSAEWGTTTQYFVSPPSSITDSPGKNYEPGSFSYFSLNNAVTIPNNALLPRLRFFARWELEEDKTYTQVFLTDQNQVSTPLCGVYTEPGSINQGIGQPVYDGIQPVWVEESMNLTPWKGEMVKVGFFFFAGGEGKFDGFYFDDLRIEYFDPTTSTAVVLPLTDFKLTQNQPNPANEETTIRLDKGLSGTVATLMVTNALGKETFRQTFNPKSDHQIRINTRNWPAGVYSYVVQEQNGYTTPAKKMIVGH